MLRSELPPNASCPAHTHQVYQHRELNASYIGAERAARIRARYDELRAQFRDGDDQACYDLAVREDWILYGGFNERTPSGIRSYHS